MAAPQPLFSSAGRAALKALVAAPAVYAFDYDGTLAPIVARPADATMPPGIARRLQSLAQRVPTAVISGRARDDVSPRVPSAVRWIVGNHGNEGGVRAADDARAVVAAWVAQIGGDAAVPPLLAAGAMVEDKGLSLSLHYRLARSPAQAADALQALAARLSPAPRIIGGKRVLNLLPPQSHTKFDALADLVEAAGARSALFIGDDDTDEELFSRAPPHWVTVRVQRVRGSCARFFVHEQPQVAMLLDFLLQEIDRLPAIVQGAAAAGNGASSSARC